MAEKRKTQEDNFFVGIESPIELRRQVLEASKRLVETLKKYEKFREKRVQKLGQIEKLKKSMAEMNRLILKLKNIVPKTNLRIPHKLMDIPERPRMKIEAKEDKEPASEIERLEMELGDIESKLNRLGR